MKKINSLVLSTLTAALLVGCGGGSSDSSTDGTPSTGTDITVERGPLYKSTVTDKNGQIAKDNGTNIYTFATTPIYPIMASGGYYETTEGFAELITPLISNSNVITPITDYISKGATPEEREERKTKIKEIMGLTNADDLLNKVPSNIGKDAITFTNSLFKILNDEDSTNDDFITDYDNSEFKTKFDELKILSEGIEDLKEIAKKQEQKVVEDLGYKTLTQADIDNSPTSTTLKVADLGKFVSYEKGESWYDENTLSGDKLSFKAWDYGFVDGDHAWVLENEDEYVTITKDATNPYKFSFVDPITKEEGTFTILSTKKLTSYTDLYETKAQIVITKKATELEWHRWDWEEPSYWENNEEVKIADIDGLEKNYLLHNSVINLDNSEQVVIKDDYKVYLEQNDTKQVGTWKKENGQIIVSVGKETKYLKVVSEDTKYYIEEATLEEVGSIDSETIYTGTNLEDFISDIKAPAPVFNSWGNVYADENQTRAYVPIVADNLKVTYSLFGEEANYFNIDSETGVVTFKVAPDYETKVGYSFNIIAKNSAGKSSTQLVNIKINDLEEIVTPPVDETIFSKSDLVGKKLVVANETFFFEENRVVLGDSGADYTTTLTYSSVENNKIILSNGDIIEKATDGYKITFESGTSNQEIFSALSLSTYTSDELNNALADVEQTTTPTQPTSFVSGKTIVATDDEGSMTSTFNANGNYSESFTNPSGTCTGKWIDLGSDKIGVTCEDEGTDVQPEEGNPSTNILEFSSSTITVNGTVTITEPSTIPYDMTISSVSDIAR